MCFRTVLWSLLLPLCLIYRALAYNPLPRWGQATALINDALFVHGGKTDQFNSFSYTSAPNNNDLLLLSLSSPFSALAPPWELISSSTNSTTSWGPALAWHTLSAIDSTRILSFGGQPDPNSPTVVFDGADSASLLNVSSSLTPTWITEPVSWANEPMRRIYHSMTSTASGLMVIIGGEKADGSNNALSDHSAFEAAGPTFKPLPTPNAPPDLYGHASISLSDGRVLVLGGYSQSRNALIPLSTIWVLDTNQLTWSTAQVSGDVLPAPRRGFASTVLSDGKIIIHGGCDAVLQTNFGDGWILDTTQNPMKWSQINVLSQLGSRRDHFAISLGNQVIFGFGYEDNAPAPAPLQIYDIPSGTFVSSFTPRPPAATSTQTSSLTNNPHSSTTLGITHPTSTMSPDHSNSHSKKATPIALGTTFGLLALLAAIFSVYYVRRKHFKNGDQRHFLGIDGDNYGGSGDLVDAGLIPAARYYGEKRRNGLGWNRGILNSIGVTWKMGNIGHIQERRDMLADEDTKDLGEWYNARQREGTGGSSWSLRSVLGERRSRFPSSSSHPRGGMDPFADDASFIRDEETYIIGGATTSGRPSGRRDMSFTSIRSNLSYTDPFADPIQEEGRGPSEADRLQRNNELVHQIRLVPHSSQPPPAIENLLPMAQGHALSPLSEKTSQNTLPLEDLSNQGSSLAHSFENSSSRSTASRLTSMTSFDPPGSLPLTTTIVPAHSPSSQPIRRSDSWWSRFARSNLIDRKSSVSSKGSVGQSEFRDLNPVPRLHPIEESVHSASHDRSLPPSQLTQGEQASEKESKTRVYGGGHGKSLSSLRTVDSEAIERMAGTMDVVQRIKTASHHSRESGSSAGNLSLETPSLDERSAFGALDMFSSPVEMTPKESSRVPLLNLNTRAPPPAITPPKSLSSGSTSASLSPNGTSRPRSPPAGGVASRIQAYEQRMSPNQTPSPTNTRQREERMKKPITVNYGLAPRPNLFIANPDHKLSSSGES